MKTIITTLSVLALTAGAAFAGSADNYHSKIGDRSLFGLVDGGNATQRDTLDMRGASGFTNSPEHNAATDHRQSKIGDRRLFGNVDGGAVADGPTVRVRTYH